MSGAVANPFDDSALLAGLSEDLFVRARAPWTMRMMLTLTGAQREATLSECPVCLEVPARTFLSPCCRQVFCAPHFYACADCPCCRHPRNWACPRCTLINVDFAPACTACATEFVALAPSAPPAPRLAAPPPRLTVRRSSSSNGGGGAVGRVPPLSPVVPALHNHPTSPLATIAQGTVLARASGGGLFSSSSFRPAQWSLDHVGLQLIFAPGGGATPTGHRRPSASSIRRVLIHAFMCAHFPQDVGGLTRSLVGQGVRLRRGSS